MKQKFTGLLGKTEEEQLAKYKELLDLPIDPGHTTAGRIELLNMLLFGSPEDDCECDEEK